MSIESNSSWPTGADIDSFYDSQDTTEWELAQILLWQFRINLLAGYNFRVITTCSGEEEVPIILGISKTKELQMFIYQRSQEVVFQYASVSIFILVDLLKRLVPEQQAAVLDTAYLNGNLNPVAELFADQFDLSYAEAMEIIYSLTKQAPRVRSISKKRNLPEE